jgi:hypothetical protein
LHHNSGRFVDTQAEQAGVVVQHALQALLAIAANKVLVDDRAGHKAEALSHLGDLASLADHDGRHHGRARRGAADDAAPRQQGVQGLFDRRAQVGIGQPMLPAATQPHASGLGQRLDELGIVGRLA